MKRLLAIGAVALLLQATATAQLILGGELSNSAATSVEDIDEVMPRMARLGLNTVLVPAYWELTEPEEGVFDFTLIDRTIDRARENGLKVVFLWFGAWKNSMSCYAPAWFKQDTRRFPRAMTRQGKPLEIASAFSPSVLQADLKAFTALMEHLKEKDGDTGTVVMMQIENEVGMLESARDHAPLALRAWRNDGETADGDPYAEERFMARHYARYVEQLARAARSIMPAMPLFVNAALNSRGRKPGEYPSAGPLAHLYDIWHAEAPTIDMLCPDIYDTGFKQWAALYAMPRRPQDGDSAVRNRLFIPESRCCPASGARALYVVGEHQALGFSPFAIDQAPEQDTRPITQAYTLLRQIENYQTANGLSVTNKSANRKSVNRKSSWGLLFDQQDRERIIDDEGVLMTCRHYFTLPWDPRATDGSPWPEGGALLLRIGKHDYLLAGNAVVVDFKTRTEYQQQEQQKQLGEDGFAQGGATPPQPTAPQPSFRGKRLGLLAVDEVSIDPQGRIIPLRRHNGDQTHQGRHARIGADEWKILHIRLYEY